MMGFVLLKRLPSAFISVISPEGIVSVNSPVASFEKLAMTNIALFSKTMEKSRVLIRFN